MTIREFSYPVNLPGQKINFRPVMRGAFMFYAHVVPIVINDEDRSANYRPPWRHIIYRQGYRAGFLTLSDETVPAEGDDCKYHLAITRGSLPHVPPPPPG
ncbi:putative Heterokaryon incompatibility domain-containing protein [Seiridium cardinale]|uniref:Heterokaryon incompatibility domain-containing protein n=1 Tax=Seiridium cardinale TaxID=138064 RepID=A0ABR2XHJ5_9PEZI